MKLDRREIGLHLPWGLFAAVVTVLLVGWYVWASRISGRWLGGGSAAGLACGVACGLVIGAEMLLWPRKYFRRLRLIPARHWMAAHIWLGLAILPLAVFHSGFHLGGLLPTLLSVLLALTVLSGVFGLIMQNVIPKLSLQLLPSETIYSQIDHVSAQNVRDIRQAITATCGVRLKPGDPIDVMDSEAAMPKKSTIVIGAVRGIGLVSGRTIQTRTVVAEKRDRECIWDAFEAIEPFLTHGKKAGDPFSRAGEATKWFNDLRRSCSDNSSALIAAIEQAFDQRKQFDLQKTLHHWLYVWLPIHIGLSVAVTILLVVHVVTALQYR